MVAMCFMCAPIFLEEIIVRLVLLPLVQAEADGKSGHVLYIFFATAETAVHRRTLCGNHGSVESLERRRPGCAGAAGGAGLSRIAPDGAAVYEK